MARTPARRKGKASSGMRPARGTAGGRKVSPIPEGHHTATPNLVLKDAAAAIAFYEKALGAKELMRMPGPDGKSIWHAEIRIGNSIVYLNDEMPTGPVRAPGPSHQATCSIVLYVPDCDALYQRAVNAGATGLTPVADMFWGDRMGTVTDPFGYSWMIATHVKDLSEAELAKAAEAARAAASPEAARPADASPAPAAESAPASA